MKLFGKKKGPKLGKRWEFEDKHLPEIWRYLEKASGNKVDREGYFHFRGKLSVMIPETEGKVILLDIEKTTGRPFVSEVLE